MALFEDKVKKIKDDIKADDKLFENKSWLFLIHRLMRIFRPRYGLFSYVPNFGSEIGLQSPPEGTLNKRPHNPKFPKEDAMQKGMWELIQKISSQKE